VISNVYSIRVDLWLLLYLSGVDTIGNPEIFEKYMRSEKILNPFFMRQASEPAERRPRWK